MFMFVLVVFVFRFPYFKQMMFYALAKTLPYCREKWRIKTLDDPTSTFTLTSLTNTGTSTMQTKSKNSLSAVHCAFMSQETVVRQWVYLVKLCESWLAASAREDLEAFHESAGEFGNRIL